MLSFLRHIQLEKQPKPIFMSTIKSFTIYADDATKENALSRAYQHDKKYFPDMLYTADDEGKTPFTQAVLKGDLFTVKWLLKKNPNINLDEAFRHAAKKANEAELQMIGAMSPAEQWIVTMEQQLKPVRNEIFKMMIERSEQPVLLATIQSFTPFTTDQQKEIFLRSAYEHDKKWLADDKKPMKEKIFKLMIEYSEEPVLCATINSFTANTTAQEKTNLLHIAYEHDKRRFPNELKVAVEGNATIQAGLKGDMVTLLWLASKQQAVPQEMSPISISHASDNISLPSPSNVSSNKQLKGKSSRLNKAGYFSQHRVGEPNHWEPFITANNPAPSRRQRSIVG